MRNQEWDSSFAQLNSLDLSQLVLCFCGLDSVNRESTLGVVYKSEVFPGLFDRDHVHISGGVGGIRSNLAVDFHEALHEDGLGFSAIEGVLEAVSNEDNQG